MTTTYTYLDFWTTQKYGTRHYKSVDVEVLKEKPQTCEVKLLGYGPNGTPPGTIMKKVLKRSLAAFATKDLWFKTVHIPNRLPYKD